MQEEGIQIDKWETGATLAYTAMWTDLTNELRRHATPDIFPRADSEYFLQNIPPMFITVFHKDAAPVPRENPSAKKSQKTRPLAADRA